MQYHNSTCWEVIQRAVDGVSTERDDFARRYEGPVRTYLMARWQGTQHIADVDDAVQEVFCECFREGGVLQKADANSRKGFRPFLYGVVRNVALRVESAQARRRERLVPSSVLGETPIRDDRTLSEMFDRAWAASLVKEARALLQERATNSGERERKWVALLVARFEEEQPIREIADLWKVDPAWLHNEFARAKQAFREALVTVIRHHSPDDRHADIEAECREIMRMLG